MVMSAISDDLETVFSTDVFAEEAVFTFAGTGESKTVKGIFDREDVPIDDAGFTQYVKETKFTCKSADITGLLPNDTLRIRTVTYYVATTVDDGQGVVEIILSTVGI